MTVTRKAASAAAGFLLIATTVFAAEPVRRVGVYVQPYYEAARAANTPPKVAVGRTYDGLLSSMQRDDIVKARDTVLADPENVTPMTMMVLAIRFYDVGMRDDAMFWFYVAKARYTTLEDVIDVRAPGLASASEAVKNFAILAGPTINGYAFCDRTKQYAANLKAIDWVEAHPYYVIFMDRIAAKPGDRKANLEKSIKAQRAYAEAEHAKFEDPKFTAQFTAARKKNGADTAYCWK
jgi:hypothetical protein